MDSAERERSEDMIDEMMARKQSVQVPKVEHFNMNGKQAEVIDTHINLGSHNRNENLNLIEVPESKSTSVRGGQRSPKHLRHKSRHGSARN